MGRLQSGVIVEALTPDTIPYEIHKVAPFIESYLKQGQGESSLVSTVSHIVNGDYICLALREGMETIGACVIKFEQLDHAKHLHIMGLACDKGRWNDIKEAHHWIQSWAIDEGCSAITQWSARGWDRLFRKAKFKGINGELYEPAYTVYKMKLNSGSYKLNELERKAYE